MKNLRLFAFLTGSFVVSSAFVLAACGDDDTAVTPTDDGGDGGREGNAPDTSTTEEDAESDAPIVDAGLTVDTWPMTLSETLCNLLTRCCFGQTDVPDGGALDGGGTFARARCVATSRELGFEGSLIDDDAITPGKVTLDQAKGKDCLAKVEALSCTLTGAELKAARAACFGALAGTVPAGQDCRSSIECAPGNFCLPDADASAPADAGQPGSYVIGKCTALRSSGGDCNIVTTGDAGTNEEVNDSIRSEEACSYRGGGDTNLRCDSYDFDAGAYRSRDEWKCAAQVANEQGCNSTVWCSDGICSPLDNFVCKSPLVYFTPASCNAFKQ